MRRQYALIKWLFKDLLYLPVLALGLVMEFPTLGVQLPETLQEPQRAELSQAGESQAVSTSTRKTLPLGPGDSISILVIGEEELSKQYRISENGELHLPLAPNVHAAGLTLGELERVLRDEYSRYIRDLQLSIDLVELRSRPVVVSGAVRRPGVYQVEDKTTLHQMLVLAGGLESAGSTVAVTRVKQEGNIPLPHNRWLNDGSGSVVDLNLRDVMKGYGPESSLELRPHDIVHVFAERDRLVYIAGEVNSPGAVQLATVSSLPVSEALAIAGGYKATGAIDKALLWTDTGSGTRQLTVVNLKEILKGNAEDRQLAAGDYLIIPPKRNITTTLATVAALMSSAGAMSVLLGAR